MSTYDEVVQRLRDATVQRKSYAEVAGTQFEGLDGSTIDSVMEHSQNIREGRQRVTDTAIAALDPLQAWGYGYCEAAIKEAEADWLYPELVASAVSFVKQKDAA